MTHLPSVHDMADFVFNVIVIKYIVSTWIAGKLVGLFKSLLLRTESETISWIHYSQGAMHRGHRPSTPILCNDGLCAHIKQKNSD